jgi:hypothetical protein
LGAAAFHGSIARKGALLGSIGLFVVFGLFVGFAGPAAAGPQALTLVYCADEPPVPKPHRCNFRVPEYSSYVVTGLTWKHWGSSRATATGTSQITGERVRIVLSRRVTCQVGPPRAVKTYTWMVLDIKGFEPWSFPIPDCDGPP